MFHSKISRAKWKEVEWLQFLRSVLLLFYLNKYLMAWRFRPAGKNYSARVVKSAAWYIPPSNYRIDGMEKYVHTSRLFQSELHQSLWRSSAREGHSFEAIQTWISHICFGAVLVGWSFHHTTIKAGWPTSKNPTIHQFPWLWQKKCGCNVFLLWSSLKVRCNFLIDRSPRKKHSF